MTNQEELEISAKKSGRLVMLLQTKMKKYLDRLTAQGKVDSLKIIAAEFGGNTEYDGFNRIFAYTKIKTVVSYEQLLFVWHYVREIDKEMAAEYLRDIFNYDGIEVR